MLLSRYQSLLGASQEAARKAASLVSAPKPIAEDPAADPEVAKIRYIDQKDTQKRKRKEDTLVCDCGCEKWSVPLTLTFVRMVWCGVLQSAVCAGSSE